MRELLTESFRAAVAAADPRTILAAELPEPPRGGRTLVVGAGKAAGSMALAVERHWPKSAPLQGIAVTRYRHALPTERIRVIEAGHPLPDAAGEAGAREILAAVSSLGEHDLLLALISGGGSSLLALPAEGISMHELRALTSQLLACGATIQEINAVRKHLSAIQGGRLAAACKAPILALIISDVTGDDPTHIASGPCAPDPSTFRDALDVLERYKVQAPATIAAHLARGARGAIDETPKPGDPRFVRVENRVIATAHRSLETAAQLFRARGIRPLVLGDTVTGEATEVAKVMAALAREARRFGGELAPPVAFISGGECTVTLRSAAGRGGRCAEFLLALAVELDGLPGVHAIAADTAGIDGSEDNAGDDDGMLRVSLEAAELFRWAWAPERLADLRDGAPPGDDARILDWRWYFERVAAALDGDPLTDATRALALVGSWTEIGADAGLRDALTAHPSLANLAARLDAGD